MKPLLSPIQDSNSLQSLGRASIQVVHDLKNQLNGLKLYATFLRRRLENEDRLADERQTVEKIILGIERAAADLSTLLEYGKPLELKKQPGVDVHKILKSLISAFSDVRTSGPLAIPLLLEAESGSYLGEFDPAALTDALKSVSTSALKAGDLANGGAVILGLQHHVVDSVPTAVIEWRQVNFPDDDPFHSFAGSAGIRLSLAAKIVEAHGGSATYQPGKLRVTLPLTD